MTSKQKKWLIIIVTAAVVLIALIATNVIHIGQFQLIGPQ